MDKLRENIFPLFCFLIAISILSSFHLFFEEVIVNLLSGKRSDWSTSIIKWVYPRLQVEKHRFSTAFFLTKTTMVFYRATTVFTCFGILSWLIINNNWMITKWNSFWNQETTIYNVNQLNKLYIIFTLYFTRDLYWDITNLQEAATLFYKPAFILKVFDLGFPSLALASVLLFIFYTALVLAFHNKSRKWSFTLAICLFVYFEGLLMGFEKVNHGFSSFLYVGFGLVLCNFVCDLSKRITEKWPILLTQLWISLCYFLAALEKLTSSGFTWFFSIESIRNHLKYDFICFFILFLTILIQFGFIGILLNKKFLIPILLLGVSFHWGTTILLGINQLINPWIAAYIIFIDWEKLAFFTKKDGL